MSAIVWGPERLPGQCACGGFHAEVECPNTVRVDDDSWQLAELLGEIGE